MLFAKVFIQHAQLKGAAFDDNPGIIISNAS